MYVQILYSKQDHVQNKAIKFLLTKYTRSSIVLDSEFNKHS